MYENCEFLVDGQEQELPTFFSAEHRGEQQKNEQIVEVPFLCKNMNTRFLLLGNLLSSVDVVVVGASKNDSISRNLNKISGRNPLSFCLAVFLRSLFLY